MEIRGVAWTIGLSMPLPLKTSFPCPLLMSYLMRLAMLRGSQSWIFDKGSTKFKCMKMTSRKQRFAPTMDTSSSKWCPSGWPTHPQPFRPPWTSFFGLFWGNSQLSSSTIFSRLGVLIVMLLLRTCHIPMLTTDPHVALHALTRGQHT